MRAVTVYELGGTILTFSNVKETHDDYIAGHSFFFISGKEADGRPYESAIPVVSIRQIDSVGE